jgi:hypothetical protein
VTSAPMGRCTIMITNVVTVAALVGAAVLSGASAAQADTPAASGLRGHVEAALAGSSAADSLSYSCSGKPDGDYPDPSDNTKFISCVAQQYAYQRNCPQGQHFDPEASECH